MDNVMIVGMSGASGAPLAVEMLRALREAGVSVHLILTHGAEVTLRSECGMEPQALDALCAHRYDPQDIGAAPASGSFRTMGMIVVPASMKTVAGIASGYSDNLLLRAADVTLKERRRLVLLPRECPLSTLHLRNLLELSRMGADAQVDGCTAIINGVEGLHGAEVRACDLRAGAAVVIAGLCAAGETVVTDIRFIERGYENFVGKLRSIGADIVLERDGAEQCAAAAAE